MPHFPGWFVAVCVLLPIASAIYKAWTSSAICGGLLFFAGRAA